MNKKRVILLSIIILLLVLAGYYYPILKVFLVRNGMTETQVIDILGEPTHVQEWIVGQPMFGVGPDLPIGTEYRAWNYFVNDTKISGIAIFLVSPETYSNITKKETSGKDWIVIGTYLHPRGVEF